MEGLANIYLKIDEVRKYKNNFNLLGV